MAGHKVRVITGYPHYPEWRLREGYSGWRCDELLNGVPVSRLRHPIPKKTSAVARLYMELIFGFRLIFTRWHKPDVVLLVSPTLFSSALALLRIRLSHARPCVGIWVQDLYSRGVVETGTGGAWLGRLAAKFESGVLRGGDGVVAIHDRFKRYIVHQLGVPAERVEVIRNWTHLPPSPTTGVDEFRSRYGWREGDLIVLHAGNMGKKQGLENVVAAARLAESRGSAVRFVLMGDGNQRRHLEGLALGVSSLTFLDPLPAIDFRLALSAANILLVNELPGVKDMSVPSKLTSYFNAGVPVVAATDPGSVTALELETSGAGIRVDASDPLALLKAVETVACNPGVATQMTDNALRYRRETLSEPAALAKYDDFIIRLASSRG